MGATEKNSISRNGVSALGRAGALLILTICRVSAWAIGIRPALATAPALILSGWYASRESTADPASRELCSRGTQGRSSRGSALLIPKAAKGEDTVPKSVKVGPLKQESIVLPTGVSMEAIYQKPSTGSPKRSNLKQLPPLVFIHGSFHGAWCWAEHWMPFLAEKGYDTYSISLRGTSGTPIPDHDAGAKVKVSEHVSDVRSFAETVLPGMRPVFISHSLGGMVLLKLMEELAAESRSSADGGNGHGSLTSAMAGGVFLCSVPPSGNGPMTKRFIKERPLMVVKLIMGFVLKMAPFWPWLARDLFFSQALEQSTLKRYMYNFQADSKNGLDLIDLRAQLPSLNADAEGRATWIRHAPPRLVMGAERDRIVDEVGIQEMAAFLDTQHIMLPTVPHEDFDGRTAFIHAILSGHERTAHALLMVATAKLTGRARCLPEAVGLSGDWGQKLLQLACDKGLHFAVESLLSAGVDIDARDSSGATALLHACRKGCVLCARKLFSQGADPLAADNSGETPVMTARNRRHDHADGGVIVELLVKPVTAIERSAPGPCADPKLPAETNRADWGEGNNTNIASNKNPDEDENEDIILVSDWNNEQELDSSDIWDGNKDSIASNAASKCDALANKFRSSEDIGSADITTMEAGGEQGVLLCEDFESEAVENGSSHYLPNNGETEEGTTFESTCCIIEKNNEDLLLVGDHGSELVGEIGSLSLTQSGMENETSGIPEKAMGDGDLSIKAAPTPPTGTRDIDGKEGEIYSETLESRLRGDSLASAVRVSYSSQLELHPNEKGPVGSGDSKGTTAGICSSPQSYEVAANFVNDLVPETIVSTTTPPNELRDSTTKRYEYENE